MTEYKEFLKMQDETKVTNKEVLTQLYRNLFFNSYKDHYTKKDFITWSIEDFETVERFINSLIDDITINDINIELVFQDENDFVLIDYSTFVNEFVFIKVSLIEKYNKKLVKKTITKDTLFTIINALIDKLKETFICNEEIVEILQDEGIDTELLQAYFPSLFESDEV